MKDVEANVSCFKAHSWYVPGWSEGNCKNPHSFLARIGLGTSECEVTINYCNALLNKKTTVEKRQIHCFYQKLNSGHPLGRYMVDLLHWLELWNRSLSSYILCLIIESMNIFLIIKSENTLMSKVGMSMKFQARSHFYDTSRSLTFQKWHILFHILIYNYIFLHELQHCMNDDTL